MRMLAGYITAIVLGVILATTVAPSISEALNETAAQILGTNR